MKYYLENKLITIGGKSEIFDENQELAYVVKGKIITLTKKKIFMDLDGNVLYKIRDSFFHMPLLDSAFLCDAKGKKILKVRDKVGIGYTIKYGDKNLDIEGKWFSSLCNIKEDDKVIATVKRKLSVLVDKFEVDTFDVEDPAFCLALVVCMDNINDSKFED